MTENTGLPAAGWKDDPEDAAQLRYWDGSAWTEHRSPKPGMTHAAAAQPAAAQPAAAQPAATGVMVQGGVAPKRTGAPWWLVAVTGVVALLVGGAIGAGIGVVASRSDDTAAAQATTPNEAPAADDMVADETTSADPAPIAGGGAGTASDPLAIDTPWTYDTSWFGEEGTVWQGTFEGLVTLPASEYDEDAGSRCFAIVGTMSPTSIAGGAFTNDFFDTPSFEVVVGGTVQSDYGYCDYQSLEDAGYGGVLDAEVSVGVAYQFYQEVYLPSNVTGDIDLIVLGNASDSEALFYQPTSASVG